jgi:O-antigen/teichoic acid export membrane protein
LDFEVRVPESKLVSSSFLPAALSSTGSGVRLWSGLPTLRTLPESTLRFAFMFDVLRVPSWRSLSRGAMISFGIRVLGAGLLYALHVLLARWMNADGYGVYVFAISWTSFLAQFGALGLPNAALRFVPEYRSTDRLALLGGFLRTSRGFIAAAALLLAAGAAVVVAVVPTGDMPRSALLVGVALTPLMALLLFETEVLRACNRFAWSYAPNQVLRPLAIGLGAGGLVALTGTVTPFQVLIATGVVFVGMVGLQQWRSRTLLESSAPSPERRPRRWLRVAVPLLLTSGFQLLLRKTDVVLLGMLMGSEEVGIYFAALRTAQIVTFLGFAVDAVAAPEISRLYHSNREDLQATVARLAHWYFWPTLVAAVGLAFVAEPILSLFGAAFTAGTPVMLVLMAGLVINAAMGAQTHLLTLTGHERSCASIYGACAALNVALNLVGIWLYGALGAALATATALTVRNLWIRRRVVALTGIAPSVLSLARTPPPSRSS